MRHLRRDSSHIKCSFKDSVVVAYFKESAAYSDKIFNRENQFLPKMVLLGDIYPMDRNCLVFGSERRIEK